MSAQKHAAMCFGSENRCGTRGVTAGLAPGETSALYKEKRFLPPSPKWSLDRRSLKGRPQIKGLSCEIVGNRSELINSVSSQQEGPGVDSDSGRSAGSFVQKFSSEALRSPAHTETANDAS